jgi:D-fructose-responsive transcription factor
MTRGRDGREAVFRTVDEIAALTGVSVTTVRLVLNGQAERYRISAATRKRIDDFMVDHEVLLNHAARSLKLQRSETIGLVVPNLANPFFGGLMAQLERCCSASGLMLLTASSHEDPKLEGLAIRKLLARGVDGLVIAPCQKPPVALFAPHLHRVGVVMVDRAYRACPFPTVVSDNRESARRLTTRLLAESAGDLVFLCAQARLPSIRDRIKGFADALLEAGRLDWKALVRQGGDSDRPGSGGRLVRDLIAARGGLPRGLLCASMVVLEGALKAIKAHHGQVPADLLIGTFDTEPMLEYLPNRIISAVQDEAAIAKKAFALLRAPEGGGSAPAPHDVVPCRFCSWGPPGGPGDAGR